MLLINKSLLEMYENEVKILFQNRMGCKSIRESDSGFYLVKTRVVSFRCFVPFWVLLL